MRLYDGNVHNRFVTLKNIKGSSLSVEKYEDCLATHSLTHTHTHTHTHKPEPRYVSITSCNVINYACLLNSLLCNTMLVNFIASYIKILRQLLIKDTKCQLTTNKNSCSYWMMEKAQDCQCTSLNFLMSWKYAQFSLCLIALC